MQLRSLVLTLLAGLALAEQGADGEECAMMQMKDSVAPETTKPEQRPGQEPTQDVRKDISGSAWQEAVKSWKSPEEIDKVTHGLSNSVPKTGDAEAVPADESLKAAEVRKAAEEFKQATDMWRRAGEIDIAKAEK
ncbi:unnamed protein product [Symbiodinium natans]|uniref:Uncharacterized protein n=1 Tax=Symbiodinium natans TaxID=878477 RepID=A0A812LJV7_9DINO|nr:unnamed protein product [Symbiodinium natans]